MGGFALVVCELCGSRNGEHDTECRVCGQALTVAELAPVAVAVVPAEAVVNTEPAAPHLQMSTFAQDVSTGTPPMFNASRPVEESSDPAGSADSYVPAFLNSERRSPSADPETAGLVSANDLPDWIRQIAEQDAAKAAEAAKLDTQTALGDHVASIQRKSLPGETVGSGPRTNWLSKAAGGAEQSEHWSAAESAAANWGVFEPPVANPAPVSTYQTEAPATAYVPPVIEQEAPSGKRLKLGKAKVEKTPKPEREAKAAKQPKAAKTPKLSASGERVPIYRQQLMQVAALVAMLAVLAILLLG